VPGVPPEVPIEDLAMSGVIGLESGQLPISDGPKEEAYRKHPNAYNIRRSQGVRLRMADRFEHRVGDDPQNEG
jgi:hypothetical protein